jgi:hypothetical protein
MRKKLWLFMTAMLVLALAGTVLAGCAKPPKAEMDAAEAAVARAEKNADVPLYAPETLQRAKAALEQMRAAASAKGYDKARALAAEATASADAAITEAAANKERAKAKAGELIAAVTAALPQTEKLIAQAAKVKRANLDIAQKKADFEAAKATLAEAQSAYDQGNYLDAADKAGTAQKALADIESAIAAAVQSATRKK